MIVFYTAKLQRISLYVKDFFYKILRIMHYKVKKSKKN